jgi:hypothetical protein
VPRLFALETDAGKNINMTEDGVFSTALKVRPERFMFLCTLSLVTVYTIVPFEFAFNTLELTSRAVEALRFSFGERGWKLAGHLAAFAFVGGLAGIAVQIEPSRPRFRRLLCFGALFCLVLEFLQLLQVSRHARLIDLVFNIGAWALGVYATTRWNWTSSMTERLSCSLQRHSFAMCGSIALVVGAAWIIAGINPIINLRSLEWDKSFRLLLGNEVDATEPWHGDIRRIRIYGTALSAESIRRMHFQRASATSDDNGLGFKLLIGYEFDPCVALASLVQPYGPVGGEPLIMDVPWAVAMSSTGAGLRFNEGLGLTSRGPASALADAIMHSGAFSIETLLQPLSRIQEGPARIVSLSSDIWFRNFMLGQEGDDLVFRVRNGVNGANGLKHASRAIHAIDTSMQHVVAVYDHGVSILYRNGKQIGETKDLREPVLFLGLGSNQASWAAGAILLVVLLALPVHFIASRFTRTWLRHAAAIALTVGVGCVPYLLSPIIIGGPCRPSPLLWVTTALMTVYPCALSFVKSSSPTRLTSA